MNLNRADHDRLARHAGEHARRAQVRIRSPAIAEDGQKLFAAVPSQAVRLTNGAAKALGDLTQDPIPGGVAVGVVDLLEIVDVDHRDRQIRAPLRPRRLFLEQREDRAAIPEPRQVIDRRPALEFAALGEQRALRFGQFRTVELDLDERREILERFQFRRREASGFRSDDAQRANAHAVAAHGLTRVEAYVGIVHDQRVVGEALVERRVLDDEALLCEDGVAAKRNVAAGRRRLEPYGRLEPLLVFGDERYQRNRNLKQSRREPGNPVEALLRRSVQQIQTFQSA